MRAGSFVRPCSPCSLCTHRTPVPDPLPKSIPHSTELHGVACYRRLASRTIFASVDCAWGSGEPKARETPQRTGLAGSHMKCENMQKK